MEWTEQERKIARELNRPDMKAFLEKIFLTINTSFSQNIKNDISLVSSMSDEEYGRLMKVLGLTKKENSARLQQITVLATAKKEKKKSTVAPT